MDSNEIVFEFMATVQGFQYYKKFLTNYCTARTKKETHLTHLQKDGTIVGHLPMKLARITKFLLDRSFGVTATLASTHYRRSPLVQGGLEIPCKVQILMNIRTKQQQLVLERYKQLVNSCYLEPSEDDVIGSLLESEIEKLPMMQPVAKQRKTSSRAQDIRKKFSCTTKVKSSVVKAGKRNVIQLD